MEGVAPDSTPGGFTASLTTLIAALIVPWLGSCVYMMCQITPAANSEMAIGMNTAVLNATDQRMRSVRTAKTRPMAVTSAGTTSTQMALFLIAVSRMSVVNRVL